MILSALLAVEVLLLSNAGIAEFGQALSKRASIIQG